MCPKLSWFVGPVLAKVSQPGESGDRLCDSPGPEIEFAIAPKCNNMAGSVHKVEYGELRVFDNQLFRWQGEEDGSSSPLPVHVVDVSGLREELRRQTANEPAEDSSTGRHLVEIDAQVSGSPVGSAKLYFNIPTGLRLFPARDN